MHGPAGWRRYGIVPRTNAHTAVPSAGRRTTAGALGHALLLRTVLRRLRARLRGLNALEVRPLRALLHQLLLMMMMIVAMKIGPVLRAGRAHAKSREGQRRHRIQYPRLEEALPRLTGIIAHFWLLAGLLQTFLRRIAHVIALVNVGDVARVVSYLEDEILGVLLRYHGSGWHEFFTGQDFQTRRLAVVFAQIRSGTRDWTRSRLSTQFV